MSTLSKLLLVSSVVLGSVGGTAIAAPAPAPAKKGTPAAKADPKAAPKKSVVVSPEHKKALLAKLGGFKFGMTKDEVVAQLGKNLDAKYEDQLKDTTDVAAQDRIRRAKKEEVQRIKDSYVSFGPVKTGWDVSIIEDEFAHNTTESMLELWENEGGKNNRRFFFFFEGKLWKVFISLDVSILPEDKKNFAGLRESMEAAYGPGDLDIGQISWHADDVDGRVVDKLKTYDAIGIAIEDPAVKRQVLALRTEKAPPKAETNSIIKAVVDTKGDDHPDVHQNSNAIDAVIQSNGGGSKKK